MEAPIGKKGGVGASLIQGATPKKKEKKGKGGG